MNNINKQPSTISKVKCPTCGVDVLWKEENLFRPFCSEKCQLIDFGEWATERHAIPVEEPVDNLGDLDD